jgi:hypothetical protein
MPTKQRRYVGELAKPIVWPDPPTFSGAVTEERASRYWDDYNNHQHEAEQRVYQMLMQKMSLLMTHFQIEEGNTAALAWALACEHVPGFTIVPEQKVKRGRKKEWHGGKLQALYDAVLSVRDKHKFNDRQALIFMTKNSEFASTWGPPEDHRGSQMQWVETLESRLHDAKRYVSYIESLPALLGNTHLRR